MSPTAKATLVRRLAATLCLALLSGCSGGNSALVEQQQRFARCEAAKASESAELRSLLATLEEQGSLPYQLVQAEIPSSENAAVALAKELNVPLRIELHGPLEDFLARDRFRFEIEELQKIGRVLERQSARIERIREAAELPAAQFPVGHEYGFFASTTYLEDAAIACRFDHATAGVFLETGAVPEAVGELVRAAKWIRWLAHEPRLEPRLLAARLRREWLLAVEVIAAHPSGSVADYGRLRQVLVDWLERWPNEAAAFAGDRAASLHAYEAIRAGLLKDVATPDEQARLQEHGITFNTPLSAAAIDHDQLAYLRAMAKVISLLRLPYHERAEKQRNVADLLEAHERAPLAAQMFLPGVPSALETIAIDRAACELWATALSSAGGFRTTQYLTNPHSGGPYEVERLPRSLQVNANDESIRDAFALIRTE